MPLAVAALQLPSTASLAQKVLATVLLQQPLLAESLARYRTVQDPTPAGWQLGTVVWCGRMVARASWPAVAWVGAAAGRL